MKAVQVVAPSRLVVTDVPEPIEDAQVLIRPQLVGVCGTDVKDNARIQHRTGSQQDGRASRE